jgi:WD40 repeat protein
LASTSYDGTVQVHGLPDLQQIWMYNSSANVYALAWSPDGTRLAAASYDATVQVREAATGRLLQSYQGHTGGVFALAWSPDGTLLASGGDDTTVQLWDAASGQCVYIHRSHTRGVRAIAWSPLTGNDACIASAGLDQVVLVWQTP